MSVRAILNRHPVVVAVIVVLLVGIAVASYLLNSRRAGEALILPQKTFYSVDDGKTWFVDDIDKLTPFDHEGKQAVRVYLFTCDAGKTKFVGYLERLPDGALELFRTRTNNPAATPDADDLTETVGTMVKRPGDEKWTSAEDSDRFRQIREVRCPNGSGSPEAVFAE